jgi:hypothetical protein
LLLDDFQISGTTSYATGKPKTFGTGTGLNWTYSGATYTISAGQTYLATGQPCAPGFALQPGSTTTCTYTGITDFTGGTINARPVLACDPNLLAGTTDASGQAYAINPACFAKSGVSGTIGDTPRNFIRLPAIFNSDIALFKNIKIGERREIQLRWEVYNVFNRTNFTDIDGSMTFAPDGAVTALATGGTCPSGTVMGYAAVGTAPARCTSSTLGQVFQTNNLFGSPRAARSARVMQASVRFNF